MNGQKISTLEARRQKRVEYALEDVQRAEMNFDNRINDKNLKNSIENLFHSIDTDLKVVRFVKKEDKEEFLDNPWFNQLTESQYRVVEMYIDALIGLTFAESSLMFGTDDLNSMSNYSGIGQESGSLMDELERLGNMYEKGLLTDEEFSIAKKKLLDGD